MSHSHKISHNNKNSSIVDRYIFSFSNSIHLIITWQQNTIITSIEHQLAPTTILVLLMLVCETYGQWNSRPVSFCSIVVHVLCVQHSIKRHKSTVHWSAFQSSPSFGAVVLLSLMSIHNYNSLRMNAPKMSKSICTQPSMSSFLFSIEDIIIATCFNVTTTLWTKLKLLFGDPCIPRIGVMNIKCIQQVSLFNSRLTTDGAEWELNQITQSIWHYTWYRHWKSL